MSPPDKTERVEHFLSALLVFLSLYRHPQDEQEPALVNNDVRRNSPEHE
jgi:hypothetical protein